MWEGADYVGAGPVYPTGSKLDAGPVMGVEGIAAIRSQLGKLPLVAIGGVSEANAGEVAAAGADGLAVSSAVMQADDPAAATGGRAPAPRDQLAATIPPTASNCDTCSGLSQNVPSSKLRRGPCQSDPPVTNS